MVGDINKLSSQFFKALVVGDQRFDLRGLVGGNTLRELLAFNVALQNVVRTLLDLGGRAWLLKELTAEGAATKPVDGLHLLEDLVAALFELRESVMHGAYCIVTDTICKQKTTNCRLLFSIGDFAVPHPFLSSGPNSRTWSVVPGVNSNSPAAPGKAQPQPAAGQKVVELGSGLNYFDRQANAWTPSVASFEVIGNRFVARRVQHQVSLEPDLRVAGAVTLTTPDGVPIESTPAAIALYDAASGNSLILGTLTNCQGVLIASNQVRYANAFCGSACADVVYTVKRDSFHQDIVITGKIDPVKYGFPSNTTRLQILTELYNPPTPKVVSRMLAIERNQGVRQRMATPDLVDQELHFSGTNSSLVFGRGRAYAAATPASTNGTSAIVSKELVNWEGRTFLAESLPYSSISQGLAALPDCASGTAAVPPQQGGSNSSLYASIPVQPTRTKDTAMAKPVEPGKQAALAKRPEVVIDYVAVVDSGTNLFQADTTYLVEGQVNCYGPVVFEGGSVIKYTGANGSGPASLELYGSVVFNSSMYRPVIFTAIDDENVGASLSAYEGWYNNPDLYGPYASPALHIMNGELGVQVHNAYFRYAAQAVQLDPPAEAGGQQVLVCSHSQFIKGLVGVGVAGANDSNPEILLGNCLMVGVTNAIAMESSAGSFECFDSTFDSVTTLVTVDSQSSYLSSDFENCILANVQHLGVPGSGGFVGNINGFYQSSYFGSNPLVIEQSPFVSVVRGTHYLDAATGWTVAGDPNVIPDTLLPQLQELSTYPPAVFEDRQQDVLTPQVPRDTGASALGYHYDPLDYYLGGSTVTNSTLTVQARTAIGWYGCLTLEDSTMTFQGAALSNCWMVQNTVSQEQPWGVGATTAINLSPSYASSQLDASFTKWSALGGAGFHFSACGDSPVSVRHSEFYAGTISNSYSGSASLVLTNCLFDRTSVYIEEVPFLLQNCTVNGGSYTLDRGSNPLQWTVEDSAFQGATFSINDSLDPQDRYSCTLFDYNVFDNDPNTNGLGFLFGLGSSNRVASALTWESGRLGSYYLPSDSPLIDAGSTAASQVGLYHFTTQLSQVEEGTSRVDIGYHYVAVGIPPQIVTQPTNQSVLAGSNAVFSVTATGTAPLSYQWRHAGTNLVGATNSTLTLLNIQTSQAGSYCIMVSNLSGAVLSSNATLTVWVPPFITAQPCDQTVDQGSNATFSVAASGTAPLSYQWRLNGTNLLGVNNATLGLTGIQMSQAGLYSVVVSNPYGLVTSSNALLTVRPPLSYGLVAWWPAENSALDAMGTNDGTLYSASYATGKVGQAFSFTGSGSYVAAPDSDLWAFGTNDFSIELWVNFSSLRFGSFYSPEAVFVSDCEGPGDINKWWFALGGRRLYFLVDSPSTGPYFLASTRFAPATNRWYHFAITRNGSTYTIYTNGVIARQETSTVVIPNPAAPLRIGQAEDSYFMNGRLDETSIFRRALSTSEIATIFLAGSSGKCIPPVILTQPTNQSVLVGSNACFNVRAVGIPQLAYQWRFNGLDIPGATATNLTLTNIQLADAGSYSVLVTNANGSVLTSNALLSVFPASPSLPLGCVSWWPAQNNALDIVGTNNGTLNGGSYAAGEVGQAFSLSGTNQYVSVPDSSSLHQTNFTIEFWFKQIQSGSGDPTLFPALVAKPYGAATTNSFAIWRSSSSNLCAGVNASTVSGPCLTCSWPSMNAWHHIALTFDSSTMTQAVYVDGGKAASGSVAGCPLFDTHALYFGARSTNGVTVNFLKGYLDEATFYSRALSSTEVLGIYMVGTNGKCVPGTPQPGTVPQTNSTGTLTFPNGMSLFIAEPKPTSHIP